MNTKCMHIDDKAVVIDDKGDERQLDNFDNLNEILIQENVIEGIEEEISDLEEKLNKYKKLNSTPYFPLLTLSVSLFCTVDACLLYKLNGIDAVKITSSILGPTTNLQILMVSGLIAVAVLPIAGIMDVKYFIEHKNSLKREKGIISELDFLKEQLVLEKEKLEDLQRSKIKSEKKEGLLVTSIDASEPLEEIDNLSRFYYDMGYNEYKYYRYYVQGKLDNKLRKNYSDLGIAMAKEYFQDREFEANNKVRKRTRNREQ